METLNCLPNSFPDPRIDPQPINFKETRIIKNVAYKIVQASFRIGTLEIRKNKSIDWSFKLDQNQKVSTSRPFRERRVQRSVQSFRR